MVDSRTDQKPGRKLFFGLFIFPLIIAVGMAVLLCTVVLLTREVETPESLITAIKTGSPSKRWQKAFELSNELNQGRGMIRSSGVMKEVIHILNDRNEYDIKTRSYMALALSRFEDDEATLGLRGALENEEDVDVQIHLLWALGVKKDKGAVPLILPFTDSDDAALRKTSAYVLGVVGEAEKSIPKLKPLLDDSVEDVRWNAAIGLARLGSDAGYSELLKMVDRSVLGTVEEMTPAKTEEIMISAVKGIALTGKPEALAILKQLSESDESLKVRQAAIQAVKQINK